MNRNLCVRFLSFPPLFLILVWFRTCRLALGIYKCKQMGLVPMGTGDWLQFETRANPTEWSSVSLARG